MAFIILILLFLLDMEMIRSNENQIKAKFADLSLSIRKAIEAYSVPASDVRQFLIDFFQQKDLEFLQSAISLEQIFIATSTHSLWDYQNYGPLEMLTKQFLPNNSATEKLISQYKASLTGFLMFTSIVDYIKYKQLEAEDSVDVAEQESAIRKLSSKHYRKIKVVLNLSRKVTELSLVYVTKLWCSFTEEYDLPSFTAVINEIIAGSLEVTWLVSQRITNMIVPRSKFFREHHIVKVFVDDVILYDEKLMVCLL